MLCDCRLGFVIASPKSWNAFNPSNSGSTRIEFFGKEALHMESRIYSVLFQFNYGIEQALAALDTIEKLEIQSPDYFVKVRASLSEVRAYANSSFTQAISRKEQDEENHFYAIRLKREQSEESPNEIYLEVAARERLRREQGLPPRAVILPWTKADDESALARLKALQSAPPTRAANAQAPVNDAPHSSAKKEGEPGQ
jgi:hypothetical protein